MRSMVILWVLFCNVFSCLGAFEIENDGYFSIGYRNDDLHWKLNHNPGENLLTTQDWKDLRTVQFSCGIESTFCNQFYVQLDGDYGWIVLGKKYYDQEDLNGFVTFTDDEWLVAQTEGYVYDLSGGIGYSFSLFCDQLKLRPLIGYSYHAQHFKDQDYEDRIFKVNFFHATRSTYTYRWKGPWVGINFSTLWSNQLKTFFSIPVPFVFISRDCKRQSHRQFN